MSQFIQSLEQRRLMSVTGFTLESDHQTVVADAKATRASLQSRRDTAVALRNEVVDGNEVQRYQIRPGCEQPACRDADCDKR